MIVARSVSKFFGYGKRRRDVLLDLSFAIDPGDSAIIYGLPRSGKSTLAAILAGLSRPNRGKVIRYGVISLPIGSPVAMAFGETPSEGCYVLSKLYSMKKSTLEDFVEDFADLQGWMDVPLRVLPKEKRLRMIYGIAYGLDADGYIVDGRPYLGGDAFAQKCRLAFEQRMRTAPCLCLTEDLKPGVIPNAVGGILCDGRVRMYETAEQAALVYARMRADAALDLVEFARELMRAGDQERAIVCLEDVIAEDPTNSLALELLSGIAWRDNDFSRVLALTASVTDLSTSSVVALSMRGRAAERVGDMEQAIACGTEILRRDAQNKEAALLVAKCQMVLGNHVSAAAIWIDLSGGQMGRQLITAARCFLEAQMWSELLDLVERTSSAEGESDPTFMSFGLRAALAINEPQRACALILKSTDLSNDTLFSALAGYRQQFGWPLISKMVIELDASGKCLSPEVRGYEVLLNFLQRERALALRGSSSQDLSELDRALALMRDVDMPSDHVKA